MIIVFKAIISNQNEENQPQISDNSDLWRMKCITNAKCLSEKSRYELRRLLNKTKVF